MRWFERQRQAWINQRLAKEGRINRADLMREFDVSRQTASHDLQKFCKANPGTMFYDPSEKSYIRGRKREPA